MSQLHIGHRENRGRVRTNAEQLEYRRCELQKLDAKPCRVGYLEHTLDARRPIQVDASVCSTFAQVSDLEINSGIAERTNAHTDCKQTRNGLGGHGGDVQMVSDGPEQAGLPICRVRQI